MPIGVRELYFGEGSAEEATSGEPAKELGWIARSKGFDRSKEEALVSVLIVNISQCVSIIHDVIENRR